MVRFSIFTSTSSMTLLSLRTSMSATAGVARATRRAVEMHSDIARVIEASTGKRTATDIIRLIGARGLGKSAGRPRSIYRCFGAGATLLSAPYGTSGEDAAEQVQRLLPQGVRQVLPLLQGPRGGQARRPEDGQDRGGDDGRRRGREAEVLEASQVPVLRQLPREEERDQRLFRQRRVRVPVHRVRVWQAVQLGPGEGVRGRRGQGEEGARRAVESAHRLTAVPSPPSTARPQSPVHGQSHVPSPQSYRMNPFLMAR